MENETICIKRTERPDSIEIGVPSRGGAVKVYFNADDTMDRTKARIDNAKTARDYAQRMIIGIMPE